MNIIPYSTFQKRKIKRHIETIKKHNMEICLYVNIVQKQIPNVQQNKNILVCFSALITALHDIDMLTRIRPVIPNDRDDKKSILLRTICQKGIEVLTPLEKKIVLFGRTPSEGAKRNIKLELERTSSILIKLVDYVKILEPRETRQGFEQQPTILT